MKKQFLLVFLLIFSVLHFNIYIAEAAETHKESDQSEEVHNDTDMQQEDEDSQQNDTELEEEDESSEETNDSVNNDEQETDEPEQEADMKRSVMKESAVLENGVRDPKVVELKENLATLGFSVPGNGTTYFGKKTEAQVKQLQVYYGLTESGVVDTATQNKIDEVLSSPLQKGKRHQATVKLKNNLAQLGYKVPGNGTTLYGVKTEKKVKEFQAAYDLAVSGIAEDVTLATIADNIKQVADAPLANGMYHEDVVQLKIDLERLGFKVPGNGTKLFGPKTEAKVKEFQKYYGVEVTGVVYESTEKKISEVLSSPLQKGHKHADTVQLKKDLATIGYKVPGKGTTLYGTKTEGKVKAFQSANKLAVNGIADSVTLAKIADQIKHVADVPLSNGMYHNDVIKLKRDLASLGFKVPGNGTALFGKKTEAKVKEFQKYYALDITGVVYESTELKIKQILNSPLQKGKRHADTAKLKKDLAKIGYKVPGNGTTYYGAGTAKQVKKYQKDNKLPQSGIAEVNTLNAIANSVKNNQGSNKNDLKIFIDAGHGGKDSGATGFGIYEKNVTLDIAKHTATILKSKYKGVDVRMSRTTDKFIELKERANMANRWGADYFVSIHNNSFNGSAHGFESFIFNGGVSQNTITKQNQMHDYIIKQLGASNRGKKTANFSVLRNTQMPAILLEYLFIDNRVENALLSDPKYRKKLGQITADAIANAHGLKRR